MTVEPGYDLRSQLWRVCQRRIQPGDSIGPCTLIRTLGRGAFGEVWLAERRSSLLITQDALKLPLDADADLDSIRSEAQIWLAASGHPNVVPVIDAGNHFFRPCCSGQTR